MNACPLCSGPMRHRLQTKDLSRPEDPTIWQVGWCDTCDFGRVLNPLTPEQVSTLYPKDYYTHAQSSGGSRASLFDRMLTAIAWRADDGRDITPTDYPGKSLCDIGCGNGANLRLFKAAGFNVVGIEPDCDAREQAADLEVLSGTAENLPANLGTFDVVLMSHVLEHCLDPVAAVANARSLLNDDGRLVIEVPNNAARGFRTFGAAWPWADIPRHLNFFTERSLLRLLEGNGLHINSVRYTGYTRQFSRWWRDQTERVGGSGLRQVALLPQTLLASPSRKYDSIRVEATIR